MNWLTRIRTRISRRQVKRWAESIAERCWLRVWQRVADRVGEMPLAEARGYVRARAVAVVRRQVASDLRYRQASAKLADVLTCSAVEHLATALAERAANVELPTVPGAWRQAA